VSTTLTRPETPPSPRGRQVVVLASVSIFALGALARIGSMALSTGGLRGNYGYDPAVYFTAADAFLHGRMPYQDFVLLHPPGVMLVLTPFAALGNATSDMTGFVAGNVAFSLVGAANGVLVYFVARRLGLSAGAAWLGGAFYAVWAGAVFVEVSSRLEPLGSFAFLCGMLALTDSRADRSRRSAMLAGAALAFAFCVKIWWLAPLVIVAVWLARGPDARRRVRGYLAGAAGVVALVDGPFFLVAPRAMVHMTVLDQLGRPYEASLTARFVTFSTLPVAVGVGHIRGVASALVSFGFAALFVGVCALAWRVSAARLVVVLAVAHLLILVAAPSFFATYLDYVAPPLALTVAAAAHRRIGARSAQAVIAAVVAGATAITASGVLARPDIVITPFPTRQLAANLPQVRCVTSITPMALIELNVLSRNFAHGCRQWVDSYGRTYGVDRVDTPSRRQNEKWQADLQRYLLSGDAFVLVHPDEALGHSTWRTLAHNPRLTRSYTTAVVVVHIGVVQLGTVSIYTVTHKRR
jgi:hypothetical protein